MGLCIQTATRQPGTLVSRGERDGYRFSVSGAGGVDGDLDVIIGSQTIGAPRPLGETRNWGRSRQSSRYGLDGHISPRSEGDSTADPGNP
jgi:hypothetical protein